MDKRMSFNYKLGLRDPQPDSRLVPLKAHLSSSLPAVPDSVLGCTEVGSWPMLKNDSVGDCAIAEIGHAVQFWTRMGPQKIMTDDEALSAYSAITGYDPADPTSDHGAVPEEVLNYWVNSGIQIQGEVDHLGGYAMIDPSIENIINAIAWTGIVYAGVRLPQSAEEQFYYGVPWVNIGGPLAGGHAVPLVGYNSTYLYTVTWGRLQAMTYDWWTTYGMMSYGLLSKDYTDPRLGVDWDSLKANMDLIKKL
jgi:hypothetical protein